MAKRLVLGMLHSILFLFVLAGPSWAETRAALVIGNSDYTAVSKLPNPVNDARAIGEALTAVGFEVTLLINLPKTDFDAKLADFSDASANADIALVYYAGHGIEMNGQNYLIPVDAKLQADTRVRFETVSLDDILAAIQPARKLKIVLIDACRNNPFAKAMKRSLGKRSIGRGLAPMEAEDNVLVSYAAAPGQEADDGEGDHSPYAAAFLTHIATPGVELSKLFRLVGDEVRSKTKGEQKPYLDLSLPAEDIFLHQAAVAVVTLPDDKIKPPVDKQTEVQPVEKDRNEEARRALELIGEQASANELDVIAEHFSGTLYGQLAAKRATSLRAARDEARQREENERAAEVERKAETKRQQQEEEARRREEAKQAEQQASLRNTDIDDAGDFNTGNQITTSPWIVITGSYQPYDRSKAMARLRQLQQAGYQAQIIDSNFYANLRGGLMVVVVDAKTRPNALRLANEIKGMVGDAYAKRAY